MRILILDIETAPNLAHVWGLFNQNIGVNQIQQSSHVLCWAAKWYDQDEVFFGSIHTAKPKAMLRAVHKLMDEADAIVHYNGTRFDIPTLNKEFIIHNMLPPSGFKNIDLLRTSRSQFRFPSNKLDYVSKALGIGSKVKHAGHELWTQCMAGNAEAWGRMQEYNEGDVLLTERLYKRYLPWIKNHPNQGIYSRAGVPVCPNCGGAKLQRRGYSRTQVNIFARYQCKGCGAWSQEPVSETDKDERMGLMRSAA